MHIVWILAGIAAALLLLTIIVAYICYRIAFYAPPRRNIDSDAIPIPEGEIYEVFRDTMENWVREARTTPHETVSIRSLDGLTLKGNYFEYAPGAPIELMFHGYRGNAERDLSGGMQRCFRLGRSALIVDQRCCGASEGNTITFGIKEHQDCLLWIDFMIQKFGSDVKIILTGISMGAATVLIAGGTKLPENVIGILADCGYTSAKEIIQMVARQMGLPPRLVYPFGKLGAKIFGHFDLEETAPIEAVKQCAVPVIFFHGENDDFVPCEMSRKNWEACASRKRLVTVPNAGHGLSYPVDPEGYLDALREFFGPEASYHETPVF